MLMLVISIISRPEKISTFNMWWRTRQKHIAQNIESERGIYKKRGNWAGPSKRGRGESSGKLRILDEESCLAASLI